MDKKFSDYFNNFGSKKAKKNSTDDDADSKSPFGDLSKFVSIPKGGIVRMFVLTGIFDVLGQKTYRRRLESESQEKGRQRFGRKR